MKKFWALALAVAMLFTAGSALAGNPEDLVKNLGDFSQYGDGNLEKYEETVTMSIGIPVDLAKPFPEGDSYENNVWSRAYLDELNVDLKLAFATPDSGDKVNALIASGDIPDLLTVNMSQLIMLSSSGLIRDDIYEAYNQNAGSGLREVIEGVGGKAAIAQATFDGKMMALPRMNTSAGEEVPVLYLRTDWMNKLGLKDPQNYAELRAIMEAFATQDPDGNGVADTYGITFSKEPWSSGWQIDGFCNIFGGFPKSGFWVDDPAEAGKVVYGAFQPEVKTALAELHDLYSKGLMDKEFAIKDWAGTVETYAAGKCGVLIGAVWMTNACLYANVENDPEADWHAVALPGLDGPTTKVTANYPVTSYIVFNKSFEHPEALIKMINLEYKKCFSP
ncbi:MAG: extracellular solute-binding protein, partial [Clostridiales bacterium]|nr:extracellular solute-binding protein [Clostridiales bacterium]